MTWWKRGDNRESVQQQLIAMLQQDLAARSREIERLHGLLEHEQQTVQALTKQLDERSVSTPAIHHQYGPQVAASLITLTGAVFIAGWTDIWPTIQGAENQDLWYIIRLLIALLLLVASAALSWKAQVRQLTDSREVIHAFRAGGWDAASDYLINTRNLRKGLVIRVLLAFVPLSAALWILATID